MEFFCFSQWEQLPESANTLFAMGEQDSIFHSRVWFENLTAHALAEHQSMLLACVMEDESILAILPMMHRPQHSLSSLSNNFTTLFSLLMVNNGQQEAILTCLANGLSQLPVQSIRFEPIEKNDGNMIKLRQFMESCGFQGQYYFRFYNWIYPLNGQSFDEYMAERPAILRSTIRRKRRKLEREHEYEIRLYKDADIDQALIDYGAVYRASWKANELCYEFTPGLVKSLTRLGWSRIAILYINEQPAAAQIWFLVHGKASIYRLAYDEAWKPYSPGSILTQYLMRYVIDTEKVSEIDFLTGNEPYKQDWMSVQRERIGVFLVKKPAQKNRLDRTIQSVKKLLTRN